MSPSHLKVQQSSPFNAEPPVSELVKHPITPIELVYARNHGSLRPPHSGFIQIEGGIKNKLKWSVDDLKNKYEKVDVVAVMQCAGNRRNEMSSIEPVHGVGWDAGVLANCKWSGARLSDVLKSASVLTKSEQGENYTHVCFSSHNSECQDDKYFGASIELEHALDAERDVILAYEMNDEPLPQQHGGPLRLVVPGFIAARWVKWLDTIEVTTHESPNHYQQKDYKVLPPSVKSKDDAETVWSQTPPMTSMPLNSVTATASLSSGNTPKRALYVSGYAIPSGSPPAPLARVEISLYPPHQNSWTNARITYSGGKWGWTLWECTLDEGVEEHGEVVSRAVDKEGNVQEEEGQWNFRGVAYAGWGRAGW